MRVARLLKGAVFSAVAGFERLLRPVFEKDPAGVKNFLLLQYPTALGTAIHATPLVPALREAVPGCRIAVAASGLALQVFRDNPGVDLLIETPSPLVDLPGAVRALRGEDLFAGEPFAAITTWGNERTRIALAALATGSVLRVGYTEVPPLYQVALRSDPARSLIDNNLRIVEALGHPVRHFEPGMFPSAANDAWARKTLAGAGVRVGQMVAVFVTQTSPTQRKSWRAERFRAVAEWMIVEFRAHIVFVGTAAEAAAIEALRVGICGATTSVAGRTTLPQLAALLRLCRVGLTLDTGTMHVGRTMGLPMCIIAPAWSPVIEWLPVGDSRFVILKNRELASCPPEYVIDEVSVEEVQEALRGLIAASGGPGASTGG